MKKVLFALTLALLAFGCTKVEEGSVPFGKNTLRVSSDEATRTAIVTDDNVTFRHNWVKGDAIALFDARDILKYELAGEGGSTVADFTGEAPVKQQAPYYAVYPYKDNIDIYNDATNQSKFLYEFPAEMEYDGTSMAGSNVMIGFTDGKSLNMKNACSYVCLRFSTPYLSFLKSIEITAKGGEALAGSYLVGIDKDGVPFTELFNDKTASSTVKVVFPGDKMLTANTDVFYIPLPAVDLSAGLSFVLNGDFGGEPSLNLTSSTATLERNTVLLMDEYRLPSEEAKIGDVVYETVADAFKVANASNEDVTITLLRSCVAGAKLPLNNKGTGDVTLNLNGKTLTLVDTLVVDYRNFTVTDNFSDDPEKQGTIKFNYTGTSTAHYAIVIRNGANIHWEKGNLDVTGCRGIYLTVNGAGTISGGTMTTRGQITVGVGGTGKKLTVDGDVNINAGSNNAVYFWGGEGYLADGHYKNGSGTVVYLTGTNTKVVIAGGYYDSYHVNVIGVGTGAAGYVIGGCSTKAFQSFLCYDPDGNPYMSEVNPDPETNEYYPFTVVPQTTDPTARGDRGSFTWNYASLECAALNATKTTGANTVTLLKDATVENTLEFANPSYAMTLDLNGKKITSSASPAISNSQGALTILDGSEEGTGEVSTTGATALEIKGTTTFSSGSLLGATNAVEVSGGKFTVFNGWFYGADSDITGSGDVSLTGGFYKNKPADAYVTGEDIAALALSPAEIYNDRSYNWTVKRNYTEITMGSVLNAAIKTLANGSSVAYTYQDQVVTKIVFKVNQNLSGLTNGVDVSTPKDGSAILTFDSGVATISTNYQKLRSNDNISYTFRDFRELTRVEGFELIDTRNATNSRNLVYCAMKLEYINVSKMNTANITNMTSMFCDAPSLVQEVFDFTNWDTRNATAMNYMFDSVTVTTLDLSSFNTAKVTTMNSMFRNCFNLKNVNLGSFNTASVKNMAYMFNHCDELETLDLSNFNTANDTTMAYMFGNNPKLKNLNISSFRTANVQNMNNMFRSCSSLESLDLKNFNTSKVTLFLSMFYNCSALKSIDLSNATTDAVNPEGTNDGYVSNAFNYMFYGCKNLETLDLRNFAYKKAGYQHMFEGCVNMKELHLDKFGDISKYRYVNDYHLFVGNWDDGTMLAMNSTVEAPCKIYTDEAVLIRHMLYNRSYNSGQYANYAGAFRNNLVRKDKVIFCKTGFTNPWTINNLGNAAPALEDIIPPTE